MAARKVKDLAVKTGSYTDASGKTKGRYENVGSMMKGDDGNFFILLKRTFNPAGVHVEEGRDQLIISVFDLQDDEPAQQQSQQSPPARSAPPPEARNRSAPANNHPLPDDDIPF